MNQYPIGYLTPAGRRPQAGDQDTNSWHVAVEPDVLEIRTDTVVRSLLPAGLHHCQRAEQTHSSWWSQQLHTSQAAREQDVPDKELYSESSFPLNSSPTDRHWVSDCVPLHTDTHSDQVLLLTFLSSVQSCPDEEIIPSVYVCVFSSS